MLHFKLFVATIIILLTGFAYASDDRSLAIRKKNAASERRLALVIGNNSYPDAPLKNPVNDADAMVKTLKDTGFEVIVRKNADRRAMFSVIKEFGQKLKKNDIGLFYYAGHGVQVENTNYLLPVDLRNSELQDSDDLRRDAVSLSELMDRMRDAGTNNIVILDACRDNPFLAKLSRGGSRGLAKVITPANTSILYSTDPGNTASDGSGGDNGVFTKYLVASIQKEGMELVEVMREVSAAVNRETSGSQRPIFDGVLSAKFYFRNAEDSMAKPVEPPAITVDSRAVELRYWESADKAGSVLAYKAYLKKFPGGDFADLAAEKIHQLESAGGREAEIAKAEAERKRREAAEQEKLARERQAQDKRVQELEKKFLQAEERARQLEERAAKAINVQSGENATVLAAIVKREQARERLEAEKALAEKKERERIAAEEALEAKKEQERIAAAKRAREKLLKSHYIDPETSLMWPRNGNIAAIRFNWRGASAWATTLTYGGFSDWRMPTRKEFESFVRRGGASPAQWLNSNGFRNVQSDGYWTSDDLPGTRGAFDAFSIFMNNGRTGQSLKTSPFYAWPVREVKISDEKVIASEISRDIQFEEPVAVTVTTLQLDGQIFTDPKSGLMWPKHGNVAGKKLDRYDALKWVKTFSYGGFSDWRLPGMGELESFARQGDGRPFEWLNNNGFVSVMPDNYWARDSDAKEQYGSLVNMFNGGSESKAPTQTPSYVWPVRGGK